MSTPIYLANFRLVITLMFIQVFEFLENISDCLTDLAAKELDSLKDLKVSLINQMFSTSWFHVTYLSLMRHQKQEEGESPFGIEDLLYYVKKVEDQEFNLDFVTLKQYFPVSLVLSGIFKIIQDLFGNHFHCENFEGMVLLCLLI